ncbi:LysR family transcriptional regulator [Brevundimonas balnearis]|uniref:LysR substrate-binding domain-containing protein n=1 Tax=Brevundimonas balnearis TaxID=1572858 RepID=A0ABV6R5T5_9CAUL
MDRLDALRLFVRTVETGSFTRAGAELNVSQPQASRAVAGLEAQLGARLLLRSTRRLSPTEAGQRVYEQAQRLLAEEAALIEVASGADREPAGRLRISGSVVFSETELAPQAAAFLEAYPRVRLDIVATDARIDLVAEGVDLTFRLGELADSGLTARRLGGYARWLVATPEVAERVAAEGDLKAALARLGIAFTGTSTAARWRLTDERTTMDVELAGRVSAANGAVVHRLAREGVGVALLPHFAVKACLEAGRLVRVAPSWRGDPAPLHAVWTGRALPGKARAFLDFLQPRLALDAR